MSDKIIKRLEYAYPTSPLACEKGFSKCGCFVISVKTGNDKWKDIASCEAGTGGRYFKDFYYCLPGEKDRYCFTNHVRD
jgi:hypothetical protein